jgi:Protein of unknown function (DUF1488)
MFIEPIELRPFRSVRVYVSSETLAKIDPSQPKNPSAALEIFRNHRSSIEAAASTAFDINGVDEGDFGGKRGLTGVILRGRQNVQASRHGIELLEPVCSNVTDAGRQRLSVLQPRG